MKYRILLALISALLISSQLSSQNMPEVKKMLQGLWGIATDHDVTIAISGDSLLEYSLKDDDMGLFTCKLSKKPCDSEAFIPSTTGVYLTIESDDDEDEKDDLCGGIKYLDNKYLILQIDKDSYVEFEKLVQ